jgi:hypothetical protein
MPQDPNYIKLSKQNLNLLFTINCSQMKFPLEKDYVDLRKFAANQPSNRSATRTAYLYPHKAPITLLASTYVIIASCSR